MDTLGILLLLLLCALYMAKAVCDTIRTGSAQVRGGVRYKRYKRKKDFLPYIMVLGCQILITFSLFALFLLQLFDSVHRP